MFQRAIERPDVDADVARANDRLRAMLRRQGDDGHLPRRVDFGFRRRRIFAASPDTLRDALGDYGLTALAEGVRTGAEGELIFCIEASPAARDFDRLDSLAHRTARRLGWIGLGWSAAVREGTHPATRLASDARCR